MTGMNSKALFEDILKPCQVILHPLPEADSDSGDSLFITQNRAPEAVRSVKRSLRLNLRSDPASPREEEEEGGDEESEDESAPAVSQSKTVSPSPVRSSKSGKRRRGGRGKLKNYCFPFLTERKRGGTGLTVKQNAGLRKFAVGCFFKCVERLWEDGKRGGTLESLPVIDLGKEETISPLSDEDETSNEEDIKVVEKRQFAFKAKSSHTWYTPSSPERKDNTEVKRPRRERANIAQKVTSKGPSAKIPEKSHSVKPSARVEDLSNVSIASSSSSHEPNSTQSSPVKYTQQDGDISLAATEPQAGVCHVDDLQVVQPEDEYRTRQTCDPLFGLPGCLSDSINESECEEVRRKKKKKKRKLEKEDSRGVNEGTELSSLQEGPEGQDADPCVNTEIPEVEETPSMSADKRAELSAPQASEEMRLSEKNGMNDSLCYDDKITRQEGRSMSLPQREDDINQRDSSQVKEKKKKRRKNKPADDDVIEDGLEKGTSENASTHSQQVDDSSSQFLSQTPEILFDEVAAVSKGPVDVKISAEHCASPPGNVRQEDEFGNTEPNVGMEEVAVFIESCESPVLSDQENGEGVVELPADAPASLPNDDHEFQRQKKKKKRKKERDVTEEREKEEAQNLDLDRPMKSARQMEESGWSNLTLFSDNTEISHGTEESLNVRNSQQNTGSPIPQLEDVTEPRKKHRKKKRLPCNDTAEAGQDDTNDALTLTESAVLSPKKKKKKSKNTSEDTVAQSDDSVSVWEKEKEKKETGSFLADDTVEKDAHTHQESDSSQYVVIVDGSRQKHKKKLGVSTSDIDTESVENVNLAESDNMFRERKRKKKRKTSISQDAVVKDHENFEKPDDKSQSTEPETTDTIVERKKKHKKNQRESETPVSTGYSSTDETVVLTKKKKKKKSKHTSPAMEENTPTTVHVADVANLCETDLTVEAEHTSESMKKKKKKCVDVVLPEGKLLPESTEMKSHTGKKKKEMESKVTSSSPVPSPPHSDHTNVKKHMKNRRRLHNPSQGYLDSDFKD
ncbi:phoenix [Myripristis murdjan]|uniref:phoenix n=1 Tax=Myripristis murdjan TaxID=586833 RepID=UPI0011764407|nr:uncharacterized protein LOC115371340 [Myripristis murdjan]